LHSLGYFSALSIALKLISYFCYLIILLATEV